MLLLLLSRFSRVRLCATPQTAAHQAPHQGVGCHFLLQCMNTGGKNTGVGCHFLLQCMKVKSESEVAQSCPTPSDPMDCSLPGFSIHGICQTKVLEWGAIVGDKKRLGVFMTPLHLFQFQRSDRSSFSCSHIVYAIHTKDTRPQWFYGQIVPNIPVLCQYFQRLEKEVPLPDFMCLFNSDSETR